MYSLYTEHITCTYLVLDVPHQWAQTGCGGGVGITLHASL